MAFDGFLACCRQQSEDLANGFEQVGEDAVRSFATWFNSQPDIVKGALITAAGAGFAAGLKAALEAAGYFAPEALLAILAGVGLALGRDAISTAMSCAEGNLL